jgi:cytochrome P450
VPGAAQAWRTARLVTRIYAERAWVAYAAHLRGDLLSRLLSPSRPIDPYPLYEQMRARGPMLPTRLGNFSTTSHRICHEVLRSRGFGVAPQDPADRPRWQVVDLSLLHLNPPDHTRIRRLAAPAFTPRRMAGYEPMVADTIHRLLDEAMPSGRLEVMSRFAGPLPIAVMTRLLGLPDEPARLRRLGSTIARALDGVWSLRQARSVAAAEKELRMMFRTLLNERAAAGDGPRDDDLVSALLAQQGAQITADELVPLVRLLLIAGFETTVNAIGNGLRWLLSDRRQWELLVQEPDRAAAVAEEVLRFDPPVQQTARIALADQEIGGFTVRKNQWVIALLAAANRDPEVYDQPERFDITRTPSAEHLTFSSGIHYCLGSPLARMELTEALRALALRFPRLRLAEPVVMRPAAVLRGPQRLVVDLG